MDSLKRSMRWDEQPMAANTTSTSSTSSRSTTSTWARWRTRGSTSSTPNTSWPPGDRDRRRLRRHRSIVAHEYFHNWTGNRITCRDWFQLCLKEGLTVFRDQEVLGRHALAPGQAHRRRAPLRARQFAEDAGPLAHPVRPDSYIEINNFYTATVYEKGAEVIGMLRACRPGGLRKALDLYFERHDGRRRRSRISTKGFEDVTGATSGASSSAGTQAGTPGWRSDEEGNSDDHLLPMPAPTS
jgi:aminopeptidase N